MTALRASTLSLATADTARPAYDRDGVSVGMVHIGVGGFHRAHQAVYLDSLLAQDPAAAAYGICGVSLLAGDDRIAQVLRDQDGLYTVLVRSADGSVSARIIGSIVRMLFAPEDPEAVLAQLADPDVRIVSLTITEGGYFYDPARDEVDLDAPGLRADRDHLDRPETAFGYIMAALQRRRAAGVAPFTVQSCDNMHANGEVVRRVLTAIATVIDPSFGAWVEQEVSCPSSMVDRITPRTTDDDIALVTQLTGLEDAWPVSCEPFIQWVIEDHFPAGRPDWARVGAQLVGDVGPYELMKMRLLNAGHQTIAYPGRLLGHEYGFEATTDPTIHRMLDRYLRSEGTPTLPEVSGIDLDDYATTIVERFANPQVADSLARLSDQSSTLIATYVLPVLRDLVAAGRPAPVCTAAVACWARFLEGVGEDGQLYPVSDGRREDLQARAARHDSDPLAVVRGNPMFHGLEGRPEFEQPYAATLTAIRSRGTRAALDDLLGR